MDRWSELVAWARSGMMDLTGWPAGAPLGPPPGLLDRVATAVEAVETAARRGRGVRLDWAAALSGRAARLGFHRHGRTSASGTARLLPAPDGWVALNLPRPEDRAAVPALIEADAPDPWAGVAAAVAGTPARVFVARARLLGLAASTLGEAAGLEAVGVHHAGPAGSPRGASGCRVVDLSSLWAGPVAARILAEAGAEVTKVESATRLDGARQAPAFFEWVHTAGERLERLDFASAAGRDRLHQLLADADVVIEASRPRALQQLGVGPAMVPAQAGQVWLSVTAYGREEPGADWIGFGDDAAAAGNLVAWTADGPVFCGDALADPLTGLVAAGAVLDALAAGGGRLLDVRLAGVAAAFAGPGGAGPEPSDVSVLPDDDGRWVLRRGGEAQPVWAPTSERPWITRLP